MNRIVIDTLKQSLSDYVSTGFVDERSLSDAQLKLNIAIDQRKVDGETYEDLQTLMNDILWVKHDLFEQ